MTDAEQRFCARQNARVVRAAEEYYRTMFAGYTPAWNLRDGHMLETLREVSDHLDENGDPTRIVVWAHNSHLGDARATEVSESGELNLGQLAREAFPGQCRSIGFTTDSGTVTASSNWDEPAATMVVRPALQGSVEALFHRAGGDFMVRGVPDQPLLQRAIGVIYRPSTE